MCGAIEVANNAAKVIEQLITELIEGNHQDNEISLGRLQLGTSIFQVQLKVTNDPSDFIDSDEEETE